MTTIMVTLIFAADRNIVEIKVYASCRLAVGCVLLFAAILLAMGGALTPSAARAELPATEDQPNDDHVESTFIFTEENDSLANTDKNYTNGIRFQWISGDISRYAKNNQLPRAMLSVLKFLPYFNQPGMQHNLGVTVGQIIYTPRDIHTSRYLPDQRPYAGWSFVSLALHAKTAYRLDTLEGTLGIVGPSSLAGTFQNTTHEIMGIKTAEGWEHQLHDEPTLQLSWNRTLRSYRHDFNNRLAFDILPHFGATGGNALILANAGFEMRFGYNLPWDFGTSLIRPGGGVSAPVAQDDANQEKSPLWGAHLFVGADGRGVARNMFLDGNTWGESHSVTKNILVGDVMAGVALSMGSIKLTYTQVLRSQEFTDQQSAQLFGSLGLSVTF